MNDGGLVSWDFIDEIYMKVRETQDDFIFSTIIPYITKSAPPVLGNSFLSL